MLKVIRISVVHGSIWPRGGRFPAHLHLPPMKIDLGFYDFASHCMSLFISGKVNMQGGCLQVIAYHAAFALRVLSLLSTQMKHNNRYARCFILVTTVPLWAWGTKNISCGLPRAICVTTSMKKNLSPITKMQNNDGYINPTALFNSGFLLVRRCFWQQFRLWIKHQVYIHVLILICCCFYRNNSFTRTHIADTPSNLSPSIHYP